ncbi:response regulator transcription factor [Microbacterium hominis]|uniref:DNA-binding response regulator n=1 Tax=Microbacterium hominis TaxID=162426 RepID=A0A2K9DMF1_9MICO|nr:MULTISPECIES: response regulator transcription factor [Microbacterium]AUG28346.1 DNA-binding response regulator [Microbacterium hominis]QOC27053.1 response regulator transcription factor [Microbacterium hominis]QOC28212.1 response regulator transcription factor [Microbacterium hominis]QRY39857.1 response regulator transcription factor [Microbacterium hominis]QYF96611.1 response regulator transcription factor [Microbacterium sp. PAMC21962]
MSAPVRVLLVDDHAVMRAGFRMILEAQGDIVVVGEAGSGAEALTAASALRPDVICMDVQMPDMDGLEATRRIVSDPDVDAVVVIVTTFDRDDYLFQALHAGASGFLLKNAGPEELVTAVRVAAAGDALLAPAVTRRVIERFAASPAYAAPSAAPAAQKPRAALVAELTDREAEVLRLLADARSNAEIATALFIGEATVKTHVSNVLQKLGARDRVAAVVYAHRHGLV